MAMEESLLLRLNLLRVIPAKLNSTTAQYEALVAVEIDQLKVSRTPSCSTTHLHI